MANSLTFFFQMRMLTPRMPDISRKLRMSSNFFFYLQAIDQSLPKGNFWVELARTAISADFTDIDMFAYAYCMSLHLKRL